MKHRIFTLSESSATIELGSKIDPDVNRHAIGIAQFLSDHPFPGFIEAVPAYSSVTVLFDLMEVRDVANASAHEFVSARLEEASRMAIYIEPDHTKEIEIPFTVGKECSLDLGVVAAEKGISEQEVIEIFISRPYRVYMLGFLPGFAYMGGVDERISVARKASPRLKVPAGSVAIAGSQAGIYSLPSPGGWQILGRTDVDLFSPTKKVPSLFSPGDTVRFVLK
ncbi:MAG: 5-oxoprolinase subunit PxpB [Acidobacteriota bacterium]